MASGGRQNQVIDHAIFDYLVAGLKFDYLRSDLESYDVPWNQPGPNNMGAEVYSVAATISYKF